MDKERSFLGRGWRFPPSFNKLNNSALMSESVEDIEESIGIILKTRPGERLMHPEFGCHINRLVFEIIDSSIVNKVNDMVCHSLLLFEPRIKNVAATVTNQEPLDGIFRINIEYTIIHTNTRHNLVFPFYLLEGTNVPVK